MHPKRILIVEDDRAIREMVRSLLEIEGHKVIAAANGKEGIDSVQGASPPDVILLDMMMPVMNGWDFLDFIRADTRTSGIPIIVVSAYGEIAKSVRPSAFVAKPVQLPELLSAIEECVA